MKFPLAVQAIISNTSSRRWPTPQRAMVSQSLVVAANSQHNQQRPANSSSKFWCALADEILWSILSRSDLVPAPSWVGSDGPVLLLRRTFSRGKFGRVVTPERGTSKDGYMSVPYSGKSADQLWKLRPDAPRVPFATSGLHE